MRALVVDDHPDLLSALADVLRRRGHEVVARPDAESAWTAFQQDPFPLVLLDLSLPGEDGLALCQRIRGNEFGASSVVLIVTGSIDPADLDKLIQNGADDYIPKPFSADFMDIRLAFAERRAASALDRWRDQKQLKDTDTRFAAFMDHSPAIAWIKNDQGRFVYINAAFELAYAVRSEDVVGKRDADLWPDSAADLEANDSLVLTSGSPIETIESVANPGGPIHHWLVTKFPIKDMAGCDYVGGMAIDITDRHRTERELQAERELLQTIMDNVPDFLYVKDRESRFVRLNRATARFNGLNEPAEGIGKTDKDFFPEHLALQYFFDEQSVMATGVPVLNRLESQNADDSLWSLTSTVPIFGADGGVTGIIGISRDVTERQQMELILQQTEERQRALLSAIPDMIFRVDRAGTFLDAQDDQRSSLGRPAHELIGKPLSELLPPVPEALIRQAIHQALDTKDLQIVEIEILLLQRRFEARVVACGPDEVLIMGRDVTEQRVLEERLAFQATHDSLTGLPNRLLLGDRLDTALAKSGRQVALLFVDLDDFKSVNDSFGHGVGDQLLVETGHRLRSCVRESDTVARLGGDEFAVLLEDVTDSVELATLADRIQDNLSNPLPHNGQDIRASASVGIAVGQSGRVDPAELFRQADVAMYAAKRSGKSGHALFTRSLNRVA